MKYPPKVVAKLHKNNWKKSYGSRWDRTYKQDILREGNKCSKCGVLNSFSNPLQRHHILKLSKNGPNSQANIKILCKNCHKREHGRI